MQDRTVILQGDIGKGKSSLGNMLLFNTEPFKVSDGISSETKIPQIKKEQWLTVIDCPGSGNNITKKDGDIEQANELTKFINQHECTILYVLNESDIRATDHVISSLLRLHRTCSGILDYVRFVFTHVENDVMKQECQRRLDELTLTIRNNTEEKKMNDFDGFYVDLHPKNSHRGEREKYSDEEIQFQEQKRDQELIRLRNSIQSSKQFKVIKKVKTRKLEGDVKDAFEKISKKPTIFYQAELDSSVADSLADNENLIELKQFMKEYQMVHNPAFVLAHEAICILFREWKSKTGSKVALNLSCFKYATPEIRDDKLYFCEECKLPEHRGKNIRNYFPLKTCTHQKGKFKKCYIGIRFLQKE
jgi:hypothetical protein